MRKVDSDTGMVGLVEEAWKQQKRQAESLPNVLYYPANTLFPVHVERIIMPRKT